MKLSLRIILQNAVYTALYVALCFVFAPISFSMVQVRIAEALCIMPIFDHFAIISVSIGCFLSNLLMGNVVDAIFGTMATFIGLLLIKYIKNKNFFVKMLPTIVSNMIIIPFVLKYAYGMVEVPIAISAIYIGIGEVIAVYVLGFLLYKALQKLNIDFAYKIDKSKQRKKEEF